MLYSLRSRLGGLLCGGLLLLGCSSPDTDPSIAALAVANPDFQMLEDAAVRGGVVELLSNKNPAPQSNGFFTVFAPTNDAFARLGLRQAADLLVLQRPFLQNTLYYHVANGALQGSTLQAGGSSGSALGVARRYFKRGNDTYVNGSRILSTDIVTANGTVHVIDKVLLATNADIVQSAVALSQGQVFVKPELTYLVEAVLYCELAGALSKGSPQYTVFAPTDAAFQELGRTLGVALDKPADIRKLPKNVVTNVLLNHVVPGGQFTPQLPASATPLGGSPLTFGPFTNGVLTVKGASNPTAASMVIPDVQCTNGVVHVIDRVLLP
ncbi:fasciclin domain-containing protein [Hymenobacter lutimineralis]|uniref:Fasciclin domain-containing protein n=1 Tax=Hymenobacter lutimineralis TaxID=2606448 RepID=A0A5D6V3R5_9BACT|nr:fasciclin domain-containing protein [Hymenobacter lutimineralis]TYZ09234.1 fasciclin domain-containing protein [Hymenobacter lutimineralis]